MSGPSRRLLVVDDTPKNLKLLTDVLARAGYEISTAASGAEALERLAQDRPDLVLLDVVMPEMSGYEVCRKIRDDPETHLLPVVMVTALDPREERVKGIEAGADDFLAKPISPPELLARVKSLLRIRDLHETVRRQAAELAGWNKTLEERVEQQVAEINRLERLKSFFAPPVAELVARGEDLLKPHRRRVAVVVAELRGFTDFAETAEPEEMLSVLAEYHREMGRVVTEQGGTIERLAAEGMTIFFNDPIEVPDPETRAVRTAVGMRDAFEGLKARWSRLGYDLGLGIGIEAGYATLGVIGFDKRSDYACIGPVTNRARRLGAAAEPGQILASERFFALLGGGIEVERVAELSLTGFRRPVVAHNIVGLREPARADSSSEPGLPTFEGVFRRDGDYWTIGFGGQTLRLKDARGLRYLACLLRDPGQEIASLVLVVAGRDLEEPSAPPFNGAADGLHPQTADAGEVLDATAVAQYRARLGELRSELEEARRSNDLGRIDRLEEEIAFLESEVSAGLGIGGRHRRAASAAERARIAVRKAIGEVLKKINREHPTLGRHLAASIHTGALCTYAVDPNLRVVWRT